MHKISTFEGLIGHYTVLSQILIMLDLRVFVQIFEAKKWASANFYAFCMSASSLSLRLLCHLYHLWSPPTATEFHLANNDHHFRKKITSQTIWTLTPSVRKLCFRKIFTEVGRTSTQETSRWNQKSRFPTYNSFAQWLSLFWARWSHCFWPRMISSCCSFLCST